jgi:large subunit ribosomal protein L31
MKQDIHPKYYPEAKVTCACGNTWTTGSTLKAINTDVCSKCHPFFTGEQRIVDSEGQVDRFYRKLDARKHYLDEIEAREAERVSPERPLTDLELSSRALDAMSKAGVTTCGDALAKLEIGEGSLLAIDGFGRKSLSDLKKRLRKLGYQIPDASEQVAA